MTTSWLTTARRALDVLEATQGEALQRAAEVAADSIASGHVMYAFGTGHSRMPVEEFFPRYGSFPGFHPIVELSMTFHTQVVGANGQRQAMFIERTEGLAQSVLDSFRLRPGDSMIVFSVSGLNAVPVEMAMGARGAAIPVVAVTSLAETLAGSPRHSTGTRLIDHADVVIDLCSPVGDALCSVDGLPEPVGPVSTFTAVAVVNEIKVRVAHLLAARGIVPPVITSARLVGPERSEQLFDAAYLEFAQRAVGTLRTTAEPT